KETPITSRERTSETRAVHDHYSRNYIRRCARDGESGGCHARSETRPCLHQRSREGKSRCSDGQARREPSRSSDSARKKCGLEIHAPARLPLRRFDRTRGARFRNLATNREAS